MLKFTFFRVCMYVCGGRWGRERLVAFIFESSHRVCLIEPLLYDNVCAMNITYIVHNVQDYILNFF